MALNIKLDLCLPRDTATVPLVRHVLRHTLDEFGVTRCGSAWRSTWRPS